MSVALELLAAILRSRIGLAAVVGLVAFIGGLTEGHRVAAMACREQEVAARLASAQRDAQIQRDVAELSRHRADELESQAKTLQEQVDDYAAQLHDVGACRLTDDDARRLRSIGHAPAPGRRPR